MNDSILDDLFHGCAWAAFIEERRLAGGPPSSDATRRTAYRFYEEALAEKNRRPAAPQVDPQTQLVPPKPATDTHD